MAKLTAAQRRRLPKSAYAYPSVKKYPIHDRGHARAALREAGKSSTYGTLAHVRRKVKARFPSMVKSTTAKSSTSNRRRSRSKQ